MEGILAKYRSFALNTPHIWMPSAWDILALAPKLAGMYLGGVMGLYSLTARRSSRVVVLESKMLVVEIVEGIDITSTMRIFDCAYMRSCTNI